MKTASGKAGEDHICQWLKGQGYIIVARNYHSRYGEIDIYCPEGIVPGVVEVKTREEGSLVQPLKPLHRKSRRNFWPPLKTI